MCGILNVVKLPFLLLNVVVFLHLVVDEMGLDNYIHVLVQVVGVYQLHQTLQLPL